MIVKIIILRLLGSSDDKEREDRRSKTRRAAPVHPTPGAPVHPTLVGRTDATMFGAGGNRSQVSLEAPVEPTVQERASMHWPSYVPETMSRAQKKFLQHRFNRRCIGAYHRCNDVSLQEKIPSAPVEPVKHRFNRWSLRQPTGVQRLLHVMSDRMNRRYPTKRHRFFR